MRKKRILAASVLIGLIIPTLVFGQTDSTKQKLKTVNDLKKAEQLKSSQLKKPPMKKPKAINRRRNEAPPVEMKDSRITFEYTSFDFGLAPKGSKITHRFPVSNTGKDTLVITKVKPT